MDEIIEKYVRKYIRVKGNEIFVSVTNINVLCGKISDMFSVGYTYFINWIRHEYPHITYVIDMDGEIYHIKYGVGYSVIPKHEIASNLKRYKEAWKN